MIKKKRVILLCLVIAILSVAFTFPSYTEDRDTILLARVIYALGKNESYETKLALGTVVMNRVNNAWFGDSVNEVLTEQQQFPCGEKYDDESLNAAHAVLTGTRTLSTSALYYQATDSDEVRAEAPLAIVGGYAFYDSTDRI